MFLVNANRIFALAQAMRACRRSLLQTEVRRTSLQRGIMPHQTLHIARHYWLSAAARFRYNVPTKFRRTGISTSILPNGCQRSVTVSTESDVKKFLNSIELEMVSQPFGKVGRVLNVAISDEAVSVQLQLGFPARSEMESIRSLIATQLRAETKLATVDVDIETKIVAHSVRGNADAIPGIKNIIAIASGKGGVGKSTVAANIALALAAEGASVGVLDADIYGPSQPHMLNLVGQRPESDDGKTMMPLTGHGLQVMSIGFLVDPDQPMIWRGPMVTSALNQLMYQTQWNELDYLIVDMPPGTGDIQLTLSQKIPVSGVVIVTTPQHIATLDARKGLAMFRKVKVPILGLVENMSMHVCSECGHEDAIFGAGGAEKMVEDFDVPLLGKIPLDARIREQTDGGTPTVIAEPESVAAGAYRRIAIRIAVEQAAQQTDYSTKFGKIVVEGMT